MGKHDSGYEKIDKDRYQTPRWVVEAACEHINIRGKVLWEPFCAQGQISEALLALGAAKVLSTDIEDCGYPVGDLASGGFLGTYDFVSDVPPPVGPSEFEGIFSNPPYGDRGKLAEEIIRRGLKMIENSSRFMCLLLPADFDSASTRYELFEGSAAFLGKITLRKRIKWFDRPVPCKPCSGIGAIEGVKCMKCRGKGEKKVGPKENHVWAVWQQPLLAGKQQQRILYAPARAA